jgi:hypothetical protein
MSEEHEERFASKMNFPQAPEERCDERPLDAHLRGPAPSSLSKKSSLRSLFGRVSSAQAFPNPVTMYEPLLASRFSTMIPCFSAASSSSENARKP